MLSTWNLRLGATLVYPLLDRFKVCHDINTQRLDLPVGLHGAQVEPDDLKGMEMLDWALDGIVSLICCPVHIYLRVEELVCKVHGPWYGVLARLITFLPREVSGGSRVLQGCTHKSQCPSPGPTHAELCLLPGGQRTVVRQELCRKCSGKSLGVPSLACSGTG